MTSPMDDNRLLSSLTEMLADPPPADAVDTAYAAFGWRDLDTQLARLVEDAQVEVVGFGHAAYSRIVSFEADAGFIELSIDNRRMMIETVPAASRVVLRRPGVVVETAPDDDGRVRVTELSGPVSFDIAWGARVVKTPWMTL